MYGHKVIEACIKTIRMIKSGEIEPYVTNLEDRLVKSVGLIKNCHHFHFPRFNVVLDILRSRGGVTKDDYFKEYIRLPYQTCWFDSLWVEGEKHTEPGKSYIRQRGYIIREYYSKIKRSGILLIDVFYKLPLAGTGSFEPRRWELVPVSWAAIIGKIPTFPEDLHWPTELEKITDYSAEKIIDWISDAHGGRVIPVYPTGRLRINDTLKQNILNQIGYDLLFIYGALLMLGSKNVSHKINKTPKALGMKRNKKKKLARFTYKTLLITLKDGSVIDLDGKEGSNLHDSKGIHWSMGHFKTYTSDAPLFGKYTGRWWWTSRIKGKDEARATRKDYVVKG